MIKYLVSIAVLFFTQFLIAQEKEQSIRFEFTFHGESIEIGKNYYSKKINDSVQIDNLKMYITHFFFLSEGNVMDTTFKRFHLIDLENPATLKMHYATSKKFDQIRFSLGIDSLTNVSGAMGGDLDPTTGMYWAWQSGYINFKLEGKSKACATRNNVFQFHLGGYQFPNNSYQTLDFPLEEEGPITINFPIDKLLDKIDVRVTNEIMSPSAKSTQIVNQLSEIIQIK